MTAVPKLPPVTTEEAVAQALSLDLARLGVPNALDLARSAVICERTSGCWFAAVHLIVHAKRVAPEVLVRLLEKHGLKPRARGLA